MWVIAQEEELPAPLLYYQILVAGDGEQQITFDNNANSNYWSFHHGSISPNVSGWSSSLYILTIPLDIHGGYEGHMI